MATGCTIRLNQPTDWVRPCLFDDDKRSTQHDVAPVQLQIQLLEGSKTEHLDLKGGKATRAERKAGAKTAGAGLSDVTL
jgi:hypothetical protein